MGSDLTVQDAGASRWNSSAALKAVVKRIAIPAIDNITGMTTNALCRRRLTLLRLRQNPQTPGGKSVISVRPPGGPGDAVKTNPGSFSDQPWHAARHGSVR